jgi:plastocyanin
MTHQGNTCFYRSLLLGLLVLWSWSGMVAARETCMNAPHIIVAAMPDGVTTAATNPPQQTEPTYLPTGAASHVVTVTTDSPAAAGVTVLTQAVAIKETGPEETVAHFGEVYAFSPSFIAVYRDEPTVISFWNLQADDEHDFMLADSRSNVLMKVLLPPLQETAYVFTFHQEGLFSFYCTMHQPEMSGQILVLPAKHANLSPEQ